MLFNSPAVQSSETDATPYVKEKSDKVAAIAGAFQWGPVDAPTLITNGEEELVQRFGIPNAATAKYIMPAIDFLSYSKSAYIIRQVGATARNAVPSGQTAVLVKNDDAFATAVINGSDFIAKYPGTAGNGLIVDVCDSASFSTWELASRFSYPPQTGEYAVAVVDSTGYFTGTAGVKQKETLTVTGTSTGTTVNVFGVAVTIVNGDSAAVVAGKIAATAGIIALFDSVSANGAVITYTEKTVGKKTVRVAPAGAVGLTFATALATQGSLGGVLETYEIVTNTATDKYPDGAPRYYADAINNRSRYVRVADKTMVLADRTVTLTAGVDDQTVIVTAGFQLIQNREAFNVQFLIAPDVTEAEQKAIIDVADSRGNCMAFVAPRMADVVNAAAPLTSVVDWRNTRLAKDSTYAFAVDNWGYMFDKYNNVYRWVPATGGTAGIFARTFQNNDPWISPAGLNRGKYKNYTKMAWAPSEADRDVMYPYAINSIATFPGEGVVLWGDKTLTSRPSAFSRVNVRWAFIVAKESVAAMARYFLFEINDEFTRAQFVNAARPFLRNMKQRRAFEDFQVICNANNNDGETRLQNKMVVQLLLKPTYSINWVVLNLSAIRPDVAFTETE